MEATPYSGTFVSYEWTKDGVPLGITGSQYFINAAMIGDAGDYQVEVTVNNCTAISEAFTLNIYGAPEITIAPIAPILCTDGTQDITISTSVTGGLPPYQYSWEGPNGFSSAVPNPTLFSVSELNGGTYTVTVTDDFNCGADAVSS